MPKILKIDQLIDHISKYIQVRLDLAKADMASQLSGVIAGVFSLVLVLFFLAFFCLFISFGIAVLLNEWLESNYGGYLIVAGFYAVLFVLAVLLSKSGVLKEKIRESLEDDE
ncbi:MAG: phage holin family protein [Bacteroidota bacterium]